VEEGYLLASRKFSVRAGASTVAAALVVVTVSLVLIVPAAVAGPPSCAVSNTRNHKGYDSVQAGVNAAKAGDTLEVKGTCVGNTSVDKSLTLKGVTNKAFPGTPTLDGGGAGTVLHITDGTTTVNGLKITNGVADVSSDDNGGDCCVGGGIAVSGPTAGARVLNSLVTGNSADLFGGGIDVDEGTLDLVNSTVSANTADQGSGGIDTDFGTVTLTGSTVSGNTVANGSAGGIWNFGGTLTLNNSTISGNSAANPSTTLARGGGIRNQSALDSNGAVASQATLTLSGTTTITGNHAEQGGGISNRPLSTVLASNWTGSISGNTPDQCNPILTIGSTTCGA
jgi:hypothetical protein